MVAMTYQVLYRKYRPASFEEVVGQDYIVKTLQNVIKTNKLSHAYLFCGPRGTGKTSIAKLFAKALNCTGESRPCGECPNCKAFLEGNYPDIIELDAASNNKVDDIRAIIEGSSYRPMMGKYRVYILDEVHMLSPSASNALLKTLEEPPEHVIFILATTDQQKIIPTILSRCQRFNFAKIDDVAMKGRLATILEKENATYEEGVLDVICRLAGGFMRDALSILEEGIVYCDGDIKTDELRQMFGVLDRSQKLDIIKNVRNGHMEEVIASAKNLYSSGVNIKLLTSDLIDIYKDVVIYERSKSESLLTAITEEEAQDILGLYKGKELLQAIDVLIQALDNYRKGQDSLSYFEIALLKIGDINKEETTVKNTTKKKPSPSTSIPNTSKEKATPIESNSVLELVPEETVNKEEVKTNLESFHIEKDDLLAILCAASKDEKIKDKAFYDKLSKYSYDTDKRKFYSLLKDTDIFASSKDIIILSGQSESLVHQINDKQNNRQLYYFFYEDLGIDKMVYAVTTSELTDLIQSFRTINLDNVVPYEVVRYEKRKTTDIVTTLQEVFGEVEVVD